MKIDFDTEELQRVHNILQYDDHDELEKLAIAKAYLQKLVFNLKFGKVLPANPLKQSNQDSLHNELSNKKTNYD